MVLNIFKIFYPKNSIKRKILDVEDDIQKIISPLSKEKFWIFWYGAYEIDPKNLVFWICVKSDKMKLELESNVELKHELRNLLVKHNYPEAKRKFVYIGFESQETVDKESGGNWLVHFK